MRSLAALAVAALLALATSDVTAGEAGAGVDWSQYADADTITVVTQNDDGSQRETTIWIVVVAGDAYIRTGDTRWGRNIEKRPEIVLRIAGDELPARVDFVTDEASRARVTAAFRAKYGFMDRLIDPFRGGSPKIMHMTIRGEP